MKQSNPSKNKPIPESFLSKKKKFHIKKKSKFSSENLAISGKSKQNRKKNNSLEEVKLIKSLKYKINLKEYI